MKKKYIFICIAITGCGSSASKTSSYSFPAIAPIINATLPASLQPNALQIQAVKNHVTTPSNTQASIAVTAISNLFTGTWNSTGGGSYVGFLNNLIQTIDARMAGITSQISSNKQTIPCLTASPKSWTVDLTSLNAMLTLTLPNLQCYEPFTDNALGSGILFGKNGSDYSLVTNLGQFGSDTFLTLGGFAS